MALNLPIFLSQLPPYPTAVFHVVSSDVRELQHSRKQSKERTSCVSATYLRLHGPVYSAIGTNVLASTISNSKSYDTAAGVCVRVPTTKEGDPQDPMHG